VRRSLAKKIPFEPTLEIAWAQVIFFQVSDESGFGVASDHLLHRQGMGSYFEVVDLFSFNIPLEE
jgi:hypothetical protein